MYKGLAFEMGFGMFEQWVGDGAEGDCTAEKKAAINSSAG